MIELRALGTAEIHTSYATLSPSQDIVFATALYLVLERGRPVSRARLALLLWPHASGKVRAHRLRQTILQLKKLGVIPLADRDKLELPKDSVRTDADELVLDDNHRLMGIGSFEWLPGYVPRASEGLRDWVESKRLEFNTLATRVLIRVLETARARADWEMVELVSSHCLVLDPYNESAVLAQAEAAAMRGGKRKAVSILDRFMSEIGEGRSNLRLPAEILRKRIVERLPDRTPRLTEEVPFVGREPEMEVLSRKLSEARNGKGGCVLVTGDAGIGKSRLSAELGRFALLQGNQVEQTSCRQSDIYRPLSLFVDVVPRLREMPGALGCAPDTFASLKRLTDFEPGSRENSRVADSDALFGNLRSALFDLLDSIASERCIVILVDDVQWLDEHSAKILAQMVEWAETKRALFLVNSRPGPNHFLKYADQARLNPTALGPLRRTASDVLLRSIAIQPGREIDPAFTDWCQSVAEGNPFFLQELAHQWIETGHKYEAPPSVTNVLAARISRLSEEALQVLQTCAILADHASLDRVEAVLGLNPHQLLSAVEELSNSAMLRPSAEAIVASGGRIDPRHELVSSAAIHRLSPISLAFLHRRAADILEGEITKQVTPTTLLWACANHRHHAGDKERALLLSLSCAEHLLAVGLAKEAADAFQKSLDYCGSDEQRLNVLPRLAFALQTDAKWIRSKEVLASCIRLNAKVHPDAATHNEYELLLLEARYYSSFDYLQLLGDLTPCVESAHASPSHRVRATVHALKIATDIGPAALVDALYEHVAPVLQSSDVLEQDALETEIVYRTLRSAELIPMDVFRRFLDAGNPGWLDRFNRLQTVCSACRLSGRYREGLDFVREAIDHAKSHKLMTRVGQAHVLAVRLHLAAEEYDLAEASLREVEKSAVAPEDPRTQEEPAYLEARIALEKGDLTRARAALRKIAGPLPNYSASRRAFSFALHILLKIRENEDAEAIRPYVAQLQEAHAFIQGIGVKDFETYCLYLGFNAIGRAAEGTSMLRDYVQFHRGCKWPLSGKIRAALASAEEPANLMA